jgi:hypothetical protein
MIGQAAQSITLVFTVPLNPAGLDNIIAQRQDQMKIVVLGTKYQPTQMRPTLATNTENSKPQPSTQLAAR